ncbi:hypothetical protein N7486_000262 [Penicillium sp. IBT 16267x]|nr:hypothetical protein N7486_000262 [Penicillium sp. IBT 16267x]
MNFINLPALMGLRKRCLSNAKKENELGLSTAVGNTASPPAVLGANGSWDSGIKNYQLYLFDIHADDILTVTHVRLSDMGAFAALMTLPPMQLT